MTLEQPSRGVYVGEQIQMMFTQLESPNTKRIKKATLFNNFQETPLPSWILFDKKSGILKMDVNKEGLGLIMIVLEVDIRISEQDFAGLAEPAADIYEQLTQIWYIDSLGFLTEQFNVEEVIFFTEARFAAIEREIWDILRHKTLFLPSKIHIRNSLIIDDQDPISPLSTESDTISITLTVEIGVIKKLSGHFFL